jgi:hypothetical protein
MRNHYLKNVIECNNSVISNIEYILIKLAYIHINGVIVRFNENSTIYNFLKSLITQIKDYTSKLKTYNAPSMTIEEYRKFVAIHQASELFNGDILNYSTKSLFIEPTKDSTLFPKPFGDILKILDKDSTNTIHLEYTFKHDEPDYTQIDETDMYEEGDHYDRYSILTITKNALYKLLYKQFPDKTKSELCYIIDDINNLLYLYFTYLGESSFHEIILSKVIDRYFSGSVISYDEFEKEYQDYKKSIEQDDIAT